jgi:hypothetical protein
VPEIDGCTAIEGLFADTLPSYDFGALDIGLAHFDADLYSATATALDHIGSSLRPGTIIVFDEWHGYEGCEQFEQRAWREYVEPNGITWTVLGHGEQSWSVRCG